MFDAEERRRRTTVRLVRQGPAEAEFDAAFWAAIEPSKRLEILWDMVLEADVWKGGKGEQPPLQRSVLHVQRGDG